MLNLCFTADHELFSGENYLHEDEIVIKPTYRLMKLLEDNGIKLTLMTDVCSIWRYSRAGNYDFVQKMEEQLKLAVKNGHDVQLHLHPHWTNSSFQNGKWVYRPEEFRLHAFGFGKGGAKDGAGVTANDIIARGKLYLESLLKPVDVKYRCVAYRAGGFCIQPERELLSALSREGIIIDSSVYKGGYLNSDTHYFNFCGAPGDASWWISPEEGIGKRAGPAEGHIFEVSIGGYSDRPEIWFKKLKNKLLKLRLGVLNETGRGAYIEQPAGNFGQRCLDRVGRYLCNPILLSYDGTCKEEMLDVVRHYLKIHDCRDGEYYTAVLGHPKTLHSNNLKEINGFCSIINREYSGIVRFVRMTDIAERLNLTQ